jgi:hypothetical protein
VHTSAGLFSGEEPLKVTLNTSYVRTNGDNIYNVVCSVVFSHEERLLIERRGIYDIEITFKNGLVNYIPNSQRMDVYRNLGKVILILSIPELFVTILHPVALLSWIAGPVLYVYGKFGNPGNENNPSQTITVREILNQQSFTVTTFAHAVNASLLEFEVQEKLKSIKDLISTTAGLSPNATYEY